MTHPILSDWPHAHLPHPTVVRAKLILLGLLPDERFNPRPLRERETTRAQRWRTALASADRDSSFENLQRVSHELRLIQGEYLKDVLTMPREFQETPLARQMGDIVMLRACDLPLLSHPARALLMIQLEDIPHPFDPTRT